MTLVQSTVPLRISAAIEEATGEVVDVGARIGWLLDLVAEMSTQLMQRCWEPATFTVLHGDVDSLGRKLPAAAAVVAQRLGWIPQPPPGVYAPSQGGGVPAGNG